MFLIALIVTDVTFIWFYSSVNYHMISQIFSESETLLHIDEKILKLTPKVLSIISCPCCPIEFSYFAIALTNEAG